MIGLTGTPFREVYHGCDSPRGTAELREIFQKADRGDLNAGREPTGRTPGTGRAGTADLRDDPDRFLDLVEGRAGAGPCQRGRPGTTGSIAWPSRPINTLRRLAILKSLLPIAERPENSVLYFGPSVVDAECMAFLLRDHGIPAAVVSGTTRDATRQQSVADFKERKIRVLCNCEVLTTGFDAPAVSHIVMARPTTSLVLYGQMVGRGLRGPKFGGTQTCVILDCEDNYKGDRPELGYEQFRRIWHGESWEGVPRARRYAKGSPRRTTSSESELLVL